MDEVARTIAGLEERQRRRQDGRLGVLGNAMAAPPAPTSLEGALSPREYFRQKPLMGAVWDQHLGRWAAGAGQEAKAAYDVAEKPWDDPSPLISILDTMALPAKGVAAIVGGVADTWAGASEEAGEAWRAGDGPLDQTTVAALDLLGVGAFNRLPPGALGMHAWHGGPSRWAPEPGFPQGRPRLDKIGTGEGAAAYGHGFYAADAPDVAKTYTPRDYDAEEIMMSRYKQAESDGDYEAMSIWENAMMHETPNEIRARYADPDYDDVTRETANRVADELEKIPQKTALYKLDIPDEDAAKFLDWDAPVDWDSSMGQKIANGAEETGLDVDDLKEIMGAPGSGYEGQAAPGRSLYEWVTGSLGSKEAASEWFRARGIPGNKYYDQMSRGAGEGTRNYVIWDQDVLDRTKMLGGE